MVSVLLYVLTEQYLYVNLVARKRQKKGPKTVSRKKSSDIQILEAVTSYDDSSNDSESESSSVVHVVSDAKAVLVVDDDATSDAHTSVVASRSMMDDLGLLAGDTVLLKGKRSKSTVATVQPEDSLSNTHIKLNKATRSNLRLVECP